MVKNIVRFAFLIYIKRKYKFSIVIDDKMDLVEVNIMVCFHVHFIRFEHLNLKLKLKCNAEVKTKQTNNTQVERTR